MENKMPIDYNALWDEAYELAFQRSHEEGNFGIDYDDENIEEWAEDYYNYLKELEDVTENSSDN